MKTNISFISGLLNSSSLYPTFKEWKLNKLTQPIQIYNVYILPLRNENGNNVYFPISDM